jgi:hypothetical protein
MDDEHRASASQLASLSRLAHTVQVIEQTSTDPETSRKVVDGGLIGACLLLTAAMLGLPHLDVALRIAVLAFACAIPFLVVGCTWASPETDPVSGVRLVTTMEAAARVLEGLGRLAAFLGVTAVLGHLSSAAVMVLIAAGISALVVMSFGSVLWSTS